MPTDKEQQFNPSQSYLENKTVLHYQQFVLTLVNLFLQQEKDKSSSFPEDDPLPLPATEMEKLAESFPSQNLQNMLW